MIMHETRRGGWVVTTTEYQGGRMVTETDGTAVWSEYFADSDEAWAYHASLVRDHDGV